MPVLKQNYEFILWSLKYRKYLQYFHNDTYSIITTAGKKFLKEQRFRQCAVYTWKQRKQFQGFSGCT